MLWIVLFFFQEQYPLHPGNCWCFSGSEGHLVISLAQPASVSHVTLGHISKSQSPTGNTLSAPRKFSVYVREMDSKLQEGRLINSDSWQYFSSTPGFVEYQGSWSTPGYRDIQHRRSIVPDIYPRGEWTASDIMHSAFKWMISQHVLAQPQSSRLVAIDKITSSTTDQCGAQPPKEPENLTVSVSILPP